LQPIANRGYGTDQLLMMHPVKVQPIADADQLLMVHPVTVTIHVQFEPGINNAICSNRSKLHIINTD
jgi:hypothetical protein